MRIYVYMSSNSMYFDNVTQEHAESIERVIMNDDKKTLIFEDSGNNTKTVFMKDHVTCVKFEY